MIKYHSLQNKFLITESSPLEDIPKLCEKESVDGILVVSLGENHKVKVDIFNADGSNGGLCLNGARCVAHFLYTNRKFPTNFIISMWNDSTCRGNKNIETEIDPRTLCITQKISLGDVLGKTTIETTQGKFTGYCVDVGNPHFIVFGKQTVDWLKKHGSEIERHKEFKNRTNVEFVCWVNGCNCYNVVVYERGCGVTMACSSGVVAIATFLHKHKKMPPGEKFVFSMPGGSVICCITKDNRVVLQATAKKCRG